MSIVSSIIDALTAPKVDLGDFTAGQDKTGTIFNDKLDIDLTSNFGKTITDFSKLDGGLGFDTLTLKLTESQYAAFKAEACAKISGLKADGISPAEFCSLVQVACGIKPVTFTSIGVELKGWECLKFDVVADPNHNPVAHGEGNSIGEDATTAIHGNILANDTDQDKGQTLSVKIGNTVITSDTVIHGTYGDLTLHANGSYDYTLDNSKVQYLNDGQSTTDKFDYHVVDSKGGVSVDTASLVITINGANEAPPVVHCSPAGPQIAAWTFESDHVTDARGYSDFGAPDGWINVASYAAQNGLGTFADKVQVVDGTNGLITGYGAGEHQWLDTAGSPGNIWLQLSEANRTTNITHDALLTFSVAKQLFGDGSGGSNGDANSHTDPNASFEILWNYEVVATVKASDLANANQFYDFKAIVHANDSLATDQLMIRSAGTTTTAQGLAIDHIVLNDWHGKLSGTELLTNWNFEQDNANNANGFIDLQKIAGWQNEAGTANPMQVQHQSFNASHPITGFATGEHQWLDSAGSPGNIKIGQDVDVGTGEMAHLSVSVAAEDILYFNGSSPSTYRPDADDHLTFKFNDKVVLDIKLADYTDAQGQVDWNKFHDFSVDVTGKAGMDHLSIESTGNDQYTDANGFIHGYAGFAIDHVSMQQYVCSDFVV